MRQFITIAEFCEMLGMKGVSWYYKHADVPGVPQRVYFEGQSPRLVLSECLAYVDSKMKRREPQPPPRKGGRPRKVRPPAAA